jgi:PPOX class probable F420-dependent enzyme
VVIQDEAIARLREATVGRLAALRPDGSPHVVPFVFAVIERGGRLVAYWVVDAKAKREGRLQRLDNITASAVVEFVVDRYDDDWGQLWWVRATGLARVVASEDERATALAALGDKYPQYRAAPPAGPVIAIDIDRIAGWSAAGSGPDG